MKREQSIVDQRHVALTFGILLLTTISALETLAVTTIASTSRLFAIVREIACLIERTR